MVGIITYPYVHIFASLENGSFNQQRFKFYRPEFSIFCFHIFLSFIAQIKMINLVIQEHIKRDFIARLVFTEIDIARIINRTDYILNAWRYFKNAIGRNGSTRLMIKSNVVIYFGTSFIDISDKF